MHLQMPPATRIYVLLLLAITAVDVSVGKIIDSANTFSLDWGRTVKVTWIRDAGTSQHTLLFARFSTTAVQSCNLFLSALRVGVVNCSTLSAYPYSCGICMHGVMGVSNMRKVFAGTFSSSRHGTAGE